MVEETLEAPAPVSTKAWHLIPCMLTITKEYVHALLFVVKRTFSFFTHMEVWWFELQMSHKLLLRQSEALCFVNQNFQVSFLSALACDLLHFLLTRTD